MRKVKLKKTVKSAVKVSAVLAGFIFFILLLLWAALNHIEGKAQKMLSSSLKGSVEIKDIYFKYPFKLTVTDFSMDLEDGTFFASKRLYADLDVLSLLKRKIKINSFSLDSPVFRAGHGIDGNSGEKTDSTEKQNKEDPKPMPFSLDISDVRISSAGLTFPLKNRGESFKIKGLSLIIKSSNFNRKQKNILKGITVQAILSSDSGNIEYITKEKSRTLNFNSKISLNLQSEGKWDADARIEVKPGSDTPGISLSLSAGCSSSVDTLLLRDFSVAIGNRRIISSAGLMYFPFTDSSGFSVRFSGDRVNLAEIARVAGFFTADSAMEISGKLLPVKGRVYGNFKEPQGYISIAAEALQIISDSLEIECKKAGAMFRSGIESESSGIKGGIRLFADNFGIYSEDSTLFDMYKGVFSIDAAFNDSLIPVYAELAGRVDSVFGGHIFLSGSYERENSADSFSAAFKISVDSVDACLVPGNKENYRGILSADISAEAESADRITASVKLSGRKIQIASGRDYLTLPDISSCMKFRAERDAGKTWHIKNGLFTAGEFIEIPFTGGFDPAKSFFRFSANRGVIKTEAIRNLWQNTKGIDYIPVKIQGDPEFNLKFVFIPGDNPYYKGSADLTLSDMDFSMPADSIDFSGINANISLNLNQDAASFTGALGFDSLNAPNIRPQAFGMSEIKFKGTREESGRVKIDSLTLKFDRGLINGGLSGFMEEKSAACTGAFFWRADSFENSMSRVSGRGRADLGFSIIMTGDTISVKGLSTADSVFLKAGTSVALENLSMRVPFNFHVSSEGSFYTEDKSGFSMLSNTGDYFLQRTVYKSLYSEIGTIHADRISINRFIIDKPDIDIVIKNGTVTMPFFGAFLMGGSVGGYAQINADNFKEGGVKYLFNCQFSNIDANYIAGPGKGEKTVVNATASIKGRGTDPEKGIDVNGYFRISEMGSEFAAALLKGIDPSGTDKSIQITRRLIKTGWKPMGFAFNLRHGYIYPSLSLSQPWFSPIRIPENLEYGRLPLAFFMENMKKNKKENLK